MLLTSAADEMDAELCGMLTGESNAADVLNKLVNQNLFAVKTSARTYRYYHLFSEYLRDKLKERPDIDVRALNLKLADMSVQKVRTALISAFFN